MPKGIFNNKRSKSKYTFAEDKYKKNRHRIDSGPYYVLLKITPHILALLFILVFIFMLSRTNSHSEVSDNKVKANIETISNMNFSDVGSVEKQLEALDKPSSGTSTVSTENYNVYFKNTIIIGDSITEGLTAYKFLSTEIVYSKLGGSVLNSQSMIEQAAKNKPKMVFFSYGTNEIGNFNGNADNFISKYKSTIDHFKSISPDTKIFINCITRPSSAAISKHSFYSKYNLFNEKLKALCKDEGYTFIDNNDILTGTDSYHQPDGIHLIAAYYPKWISHMRAAAGL